MNHLGTRTLETERLVLRCFTLNDAQSMFNNWASDDEVTKYLSWAAHKNVEDSKAYLEMIIKQYEQLTTYNWAVELKEIGQAIGSIGVVRYNDDVGDTHIGYTIGRAWWNKGITSEAFLAVIKFLMEDVKVNRIDARHDTRNPASGKVMGKCGLRYEGTLRQSNINNQGIADVAWYALLRRDYYRKEE